MGRLRPNIDPGHPTQCHRFAGHDPARHLLPVLDMPLPEDIRIACDGLVPPGSAVANFHNTAPWMKMQI
ncbi:hypothetical protein [Meiothermus taiwanensis]|uniref:hypothetical protein n=1 Tax=Meiothermus taiwanensis TaxID=172827 RepID=UPI00040B9774|nr:hypothetical protein [Meiothermus taiwanensis]